MCVPSDPVTADCQPQMPADGPGRLRRATAWAKATVARTADWTRAARDDHASIDIGFRTVDRDHRAAAMVLAGGIAYRLFFWVLALSLVVGGVLGLLDPGDIESALKDRDLGVWIAGAVAQTARSAEGNEWWLLLVGAYLVLWAGYACTKALVLTHAAVWQVRPPKVKRPLRVALIFNGFTLGFIAAVAAARWVREQSWSGGLAATLLVIVVPFGFWLVATRALPNRGRSWVDLVPGAAVLAIGVQAMHVFTTYFLGPKLASATQLYGVLGVTTTILFWFYLAGRLMVGAATLNASLVERAGPLDASMASSSPAATSPS